MTFHSVLDSVDNYLHRCRTNSMEFPDSLIICPNCSLLQADPLDCNECPHRSDVCKSLLLDHPYFSSNAQHVFLFILLGWFVRWEAIGKIL